MWEMRPMDGGRRYGSSASEGPPPLPPPGNVPSTSEDLHAWSIYRQNLNSDFTDSALGSSEKSPMPYGNFHLRESTVQSILANPKYGPKSELGTNMYTYLKFGLPRVLPPRPHSGSGGVPQQGSSGYDSTDEDIAARARSEPPPLRHPGLRAAKSEDYLAGAHHSPARPHLQDDDRRQQRGHRRKEDARFNRQDEWPPIQQQQQRRPQQQQLQQQSRRSQPKQLRGASSEADLLHQSRLPDYDYDYDDCASDDLLDTGAFVNRGLDSDNLLSDEEEYQRQHQHQQQQQQRQQQLRAGRLGHGGKAASQLSVASRNHLANGAGISYRHEAPMLNDKYFPRDPFAGGNNYIGPAATSIPVSVIPNGSSNHNNGGDAYDGFKYPHLQLRNVSFDVRRGRKYDRLLDGVTFEVRGGEILAVMATKAEEGTALCNILSNRHNRWRSTLGGDILVNGVYVSPARLQDRVAYVSTDNNFCPDMSVRQTMLFHAFLREPGTHARSRDTKGRINALIEDLGLAQVKHTRVKDLTVSERQRLNVSCHLLLDADIVVLDQPTKGMDIFDTFFLVEYLRQWAGRGRIVIMTLQPPTYEILTMISKVLLLSTGRLMYYGKRREMLPYFAFIEYPCPAYKNPADYYLDLVTLDDLSSEAMLESSQRIDQLASAFKRRQEPLSDPGPPGILPPKIKHANLLVQIFGLWIRALVYMYPFNVINWVKLVLLSGIMSVCMGVIFLGIRWRYWDRAWQKDPIFEQENIGDRFGFHHVMMSVALWPTILVMVGDVWRSKRPVTRDVEDRLYSKLAYLVTKTLYSLPSSGGIFLALTIPGYLLAGIHYPKVQDLNVFYLYIGYMLLYLFAIQSVALAVTHLLTSRHLAAGLTGMFVTCLALVSGYVIHFEELGDWVSWLKYISPQWWLGHPIHQGELEPIEVFRCTGNPVITENSIIKQVPCGLPSGAEAVKYFDFVDKNVVAKDDAAPVLITVAFYAIFLLLTFVFYLGTRQISKRSRAKKSKI